MNLKPYEKPRLIALTLSGNDMLCGNCNPDYVANKDLIEDILNDFGMSLTFGSTSGGCEMNVPGLEAYCKMNLSDLGAFAS